MQEETFLQHLRNKPKRARERIVFFAVIFVSPFLFYFWSITSHITDMNGLSAIDTVRDTVSGTYNNPAYKSMLGGGDGQ
jgi:hypothetical protein